MDAVSQALTVSFGVGSGVSCQVRTAQNADRVRSEAPKTAIAVRIEPKAASRTTWCALAS